MNPNRENFFGAFLIFAALSVFPGWARGAEDWTHGHSSCDSDAQAFFDIGKNGPEELKPVEQAWEFALQDVDLLAELQCYSEASQAAQSLAQQLREVRSDVLSGLRAASCSNSSMAAVRVVKMRESSEITRRNEAIFEKSLVQSAEFVSRISAEQAGKSLSFDDCRSKARRGWSRAQSSLNKLSCEVRHSLRRMEAARERVQPGALAFDCSTSQPSVGMAVSGAVSQASSLEILLPVQNSIAR